MRLSWQEVRLRAAAFAERWADDTYEQGEARPSTTNCSRSSATSAGDAPLSNAA